MYYKLIKGKDGESMLYKEMNWCLPASTEWCQLCECDVVDDKRGQLCFYFGIYRWLVYSVFPYIL